MREPVEGNNGLVRGSAIHPAEREEELAVEGDGEHMLVGLQRQGHDHPERRIGGDERGVIHFGQLQHAQPRVGAPARGERQRLADARVVVEQLGKADAEVACGEGRRRQASPGLEFGMPFQLDPAAQRSRALPRGGHGRCRQRSHGRERELRRLPVIDDYCFTSPASRVWIPYETVQGSVAGAAPGLALCDAFGLDLIPGHVELWLLQKPGFYLVRADDELDHVLVFDDSLLPDVVGHGRGIGLP